MMAINIPAGLNQVMPYLILKEADTFLVFMKTVFGAQETAMHRDGEGGIVHAQVTIGDSVIMFSNSREPWPPMPAGMFIYVEDADASYKRALDAGGTTVMEPSDQEYGRTCGVKDPCDNTWWITSVSEAR